MYCSVGSVPLSVMRCTQGVCYNPLCVVRRECATVSYALYAGSVLEPIVYCSVGSVLLSVMRCTQGVCYSPLCIVQYSVDSAPLSNVCCSVCFSRKWV